MAEGITKNRFVAEELALAIILVVSLLVARLVIELRSAIKMSAPIELGRSGLSITMPQGNGWQSEANWQYDDTRFTISAVFSAGGPANVAYARCRYILIPPAGQRTIVDRVTSEAQAIGGEVALEPVQTGRLTLGDLNIDWASIKGDAGARGRFEIILGVCSLPADRQLEIEVLQTTDEPDLAKRVLEKIAKGIRFKDNGLLQAGAGVISEIRAKGLSQSATTDSATVFFAITNPRGQAFGFTMDAMTQVNADSGISIRAASFFYVRGPVADERIGAMVCDNKFKRFTWRIEKTSREGGAGIEMILQDGVLTVNNLEAGRRINEYRLGENVVPDMDFILEPVLENVLNGPGREIVIDVLRSDGTVIPVIIEKAADESGDYIRVELLDGQGRSQKVYYDGAKRRTMIEYLQENPYKLTRADANQIMVLFPERAFLIRDPRQLLQRESP